MVQVHVKTITALALHRCCCGAARFVSGLHKVIYWSERQSLELVLLVRFRQANNVTPSLSL